MAIKKIYTEKIIYINCNILGTNLKIDIEYFSELLGIDKSFIKDDLDRDKLLIYEKGLAPILADKYYFFQNEDWVKILKNK